MAKQHVGGLHRATAVSPGLRDRSTLAAALGASGLLCALAACTPAADYRMVPENPRQNTPVPAPFRFPSSRPPERVVVIGDSLSTGYGTSPEEAWPSLVGQDPQPGQQPVEIINAAKNGSGYVTAGDGGATFGSQLTDALDAATDVVVFLGSDNDAGRDPADLKAAVADALSESKTLAPHAVRIVIGPLAAFDPAEADVDVIRAQERTAARDAGAVFVDPIMEKWIPGPDSPLLGPDGEHPSSQGQQFLKDKFKGILTSLGSTGAVPASPEAPVCRHQYLSGPARAGLTLRDC